ncbi:Periodic tryptophan protein 2 [Tetrabaena socialis]|uniref:Periodic tryptophan protein 2 n=1 Tax=Tetrabaena socialis TaxID=47790 RepID=A0A2J7ZZ70_9CHLO|nr:Periodic tryptophan protein 2 [Tetrabaena socialis]|eukprot:PNH05571.1 Periodic tryptophan protein 2 [Tetrabaena socialis]
MDHPDPLVGPGRLDIEQEVSRIRGDLGAKDGRIAELTAEVARLAYMAAEAEPLRSQAAVLEARCGALARQLQECEAGRRLFNDLETSHNSVQRRLAAARASDEMYNRGDGRRERERHLPPGGFMAARATLASGRPVARQPPRLPSCRPCLALCGKRSPAPSPALVWLCPSLDKQLNPMQLHRTYGQCHADVLDVAWSPDGAFIAAASADMTLRVFSLHPLPGYEPPALTGHKEAIVGVFFPDAAQHAKGMVRVASRGEGGGKEAIVGVFFPDAAQHAKGMAKPAHHRRHPLPSEYTSLAAVTLKSPCRKHSGGM